MNQDEISQLWDKGAGLARAGTKDEFQRYIAQLRGSDDRDKRALSYLLEEYWFVRRDNPLGTIKVAKKLMAMNPHPRFLRTAYSHLVWAFRAIGDMASSNLYVSRYLELSEEFGGDSAESAILTANSLCASENYAEARRVLLPFKDTPGSNRPRILHTLSLVEYSSGNPHLAMRLSKEILEGLEKDPGNPFSRSLALEILGVSLEALGKYEEALKAFKENLEEETSLEGSYAIYHLNKISRISFFAGKKEDISREIEKRVLALAKGSPEGHPAILEHQGHKEADGGNIEKAVKLLIEAGDGYRNINQNVESLIVYIIAAMLAKKHDAPGFWTAAERIRPKFGLYRVFLENHFFLGDFATEVLVPLLEAVTLKEPRIKIKMLGGMSTSGIKDPWKWQLNKALSLFKYLLLNEGKPLQADYLVWLLWPRANPKRGMDRLYPLVSYIRKELGGLGNLLVSRRKAYCLKQSPDLWVDVHEFRNLIREAESLGSNPGIQLEKCLKAIEIYRGDLLPEDTYDRFIDDHRAELREKFRWAAERAIELLMSSGRAGEAVNLAQELYMRFPKDNTVAKVYIRALLSSGQVGRAREIYSDFKNRIWREHRLKPSFGFPGNPGQ